MLTVDANPPSAAESWSWGLSGLQEHVSVVAPSIELQASATMQNGREPSLNRHAPERERQCGTQLLVIAD